MMLHRHFEEDKAAANMTTTKDLGGEKQEFVSEVFPPDPESEQPKKSTRRKKSE